MEQYLNLISVPAIAAVVYWTINVIKHAVGENEKFKRCIPLIATALGIVCGIICFYALPSIIPAPNIVVAIVIGGASGRLRVLIRLSSSSAKRTIRMESKEIRCAVADAIVMLLWMKDLLTTEQRDEIINKNKLSFLS